MRSGNATNDNGIALNPCPESNERPPSYREFLPPAHLRDVVECFWHRDSRAPRTETWILPDGCMDVIWRDGAPPFVAGPDTVPCRVAIDAQAAITGVRFRPGAAPRLLGVDARELVNQEIPLAAIWPRDRAARWEDAGAGATILETLEAVARAITARLATSDEPDPLVGDLVAWIARQPRLPMAEIARRTGLSERQILRRCEKAIGYGPKTLQRVLRVQRFLWLASCGDARVPRLSRLAFTAGYADQAHMTREVLALTGATPRQLLLGAARGSAVSELFKTALRRDVTLMPPE
jgi:AraC-like DNA-binding protein